MDLTNVAVFVQAVRLGSLSAASKHLGLAPMASSRRLAALAEELGRRLLHRTTRALSMTTDGALFLAHAEAMLCRRGRPRGAGGAFGRCDGGAAGQRGRSGDPRTARGSGMTPTLAQMLEGVPETRPGCRLLWEAGIRIGPRIELGQGPYGARRRIDILGGAFRGGPGLEDLHGRVLPGGADRQLDRPDGVRELDALYDIEVPEGTVLTLRNRVLIDERPGMARYALSHVSVLAPERPWAWLSRRIIVGTLTPRRPAFDAVVIRTFEVALP
ncbi:DUF3237 family protein [Pseudooceanicola sp. CBS1P-1]|uniref:DUF3237 family protein n=1 Tax=Pseudooceanicola albus TaxID=2692189 RepID=A0A6L7G6Y1_9RHOB|nr:MULTISPECIES: DUF3237 family protein [Pseudooceanicola]MBT9382967.1 DUF3237 family protein [Pseudooceanicola endophyticus]MXN19156.1 DUF3237 family protein [Pseudooceanicola albus]